MKIELTEENLFLYAAKHYYKPKTIDAEEFEEDLKRFKYIKRLLRKYYENNILKERLLINHIIVLSNVFGPEACATLLIFKIQKEHWPALKAFCIYLNILREDELPDLPLDEEVMKVLKEL